MARVVVQCPHRTKNVCPSIAKGNQRVRTNPNAECIERRPPQVSAPQNQQHTTHSGCPQKWPVRAEVLRMSGKHLNTHPPRVGAANVLLGSKSLDFFRLPGTGQNLREQQQRAHGTCGGQDKYIAEAIPNMLLPSSRFPRWCPQQPEEPPACQAHHHDGRGGRVGLHHAAKGQSRGECAARHSGNRHEDAQHNAAHGDRSQIRPCTHVITNPHEHRQRHHYQSRKTCGNLRCQAAFANQPPGNQPHRSRQQQSRQHYRGNVNGRDGADVRDLLEHPHAVVPGGGVKHGVAGLQVLQLAHAG